MHVLVAEEDLVTLTRLTRVVRGLGHEVEAVRDGLSAWKSLEKNPGIDVAILNDLLPGRGGLEIAAGLRARNFAQSIYVILLVPGDKETQALAALEAGADGCVALPATADELTAQLKVAARILSREKKLHREIAGLQKQLRSHDIEPEPPEPEPEPAALEKPPAPPARVPPPPPGKVPEGKTTEPLRDSGPLDAPELPAALAPKPLPPVGKAPPITQMQACFETILRRIRYVAPPETGVEEPLELTVYSAIVLDEQQLWLDLTMALTHRVAVALYRALLSEVPHSDAELRDALEEVCNMCQGEWKMELEESGLQPLAPGWPTARRSHEIPEVSAAQRLGSSSFTLPGPIRVTILEHAARIAEKSLDQISPGDVLADSLSVPGQRLPLMKSGTALNAKYIERIHDRIKPAEAEHFTLRVIEPSPLALFMLRRWPRTSVDSELTLYARVDGKDRQLQGRVHDISENGLGATIPEMLHPGQTAILCFNLNGDEEFRMEGILRRRLGFRCGFEFQNVPFLVVEKLRGSIKGLGAI